MSQQPDYDVIVVGAGHNGLIVASYLAKAGLKVGVFEKNDYIGGMTNTKEVTLPGFKHDTGGIMHGSIQGNPLITNDELGLLSKYGLKYIKPDVQTANLFPDGTAIHTSLDLDSTCEDIAQFSQHDADAYRQFVMEAMPLLPLLGQGMNNPPPPFGMFINQLDQSSIGQEFIRFMTMSAWDVANEWFEHPKTIMMSLKIATEPLASPEVKGSALWMLILLALAHVSKSAIPVGGSEALPLALARCLEANGGTVRTNSEVTKILTKGGRAYGVKLASGEEITAKRAVITSVDPRISLLKWVDEGISSDIRKKLGRLHEVPFSNFLISVALDEAPNYKASSKANEALVVEPLPQDLNDFRLLFDDLRYRRVPKQGYSTYIVVPSLLDPTRAPAGKHTLYMSHYMPYNLSDGGPKKWDSIREDVANLLIDNYFSYTTNLTRESILGYSILTPNDYSKINDNIVNGSVMGVDASIYQNFAYRPIPELGHYKTPIENLYLCGVMTHPGGGIGGGGRAGVQVIMEDLGIEFDDVIS